MKKGLSIAFFVIAIIICVSRLGNPWSFFRELTVDSVEILSDDDTIHQIEERLYKLGGIEWASVYTIDGDLNIDVTGREYDPELFPDFCKNICNEVADIMSDFDDRELGFIYIAQHNSVNDDSISWYSENGQYGYFVYTVKGEDRSYDNVTLEEMGKLINESSKNQLPAMGGALG